MQTNKRKEYYKKYYYKNIDKEREQAIEHYWKCKKQYQINTLQQKLLVLQIYSNGTMICKKCNYDNIEALSIDHIKGNGCEHRKKLKKSFYRWLIDNNFPKDYQVLCMNCQFIKRIREINRRNKNG